MNMIEVAVGLMLLALGMLLGRRWYISRPTVKLTHSLLANVIREKDAYRR